LTACAPILTSQDAINQEIDELKVAMTLQADHSGCYLVAAQRRHAVHELSKPWMWLSSHVVNWRLLAYDHPPEADHGFVSRMNAARA
jgi:hypothetical protein